MLKAAEILGTIGGALTILLGLVAAPSGGGYLIGGVILVALGVVGIFGARQASRNPRHAGIWTIIVGLGGFLFVAWWAYLLPGVLLVASGVLALASGRTTGVQGPPRPPVSPPAA